jgi:hypothetical protein
VLNPTAAGLLCDGCSYCCCICCLLMQAYRSTSPHIVKHRHEQVRGSGPILGHSHVGYKACAARSHAQLHCSHCNAFMLMTQGSGSAWHLLEVNCNNLPSVTSSHTQQDNSKALTGVVCALGRLIVGLMLNMTSWSPFVMPSCSSAASVEDSTLCLKTCRHTCSRLAQ